MKLIRWIFLVLGIGIISGIVLVYFYLLQRDFTKDHREFLISINDLDHSQRKMTNIILENSLYTYNNQDEIATVAGDIERDFQKLKNLKILKDKTYKSVVQSLPKLKALIDTNIVHIQEYLMVNASVKNSLLFLTRYVDNAKYLQKQDKDLFVEAHHILEYFHNMKNMQNLDYINKNVLLSSISKDKHTQNFIKNFNMHTKYMAEKYPLFINTTKQIIDNEINNNIDLIREDFIKLALNDFKTLDIFAFILFSIFGMAILFIVLLFIKYMQENKKLLNTKKSLEHSLTYDQLTNLYNRKAFEEDIYALKAPHLLIVNIDDFKHINDIYGNKVGNVLLKELAQLIIVKLTNIQLKVYRLGGDEFGILFDNIDPKKAFEIARLLEYEISHHNFIINDLELNILVSIASNHIEPILENTDLALKLLKKDVTRRVIEYSNDLNLSKDIKKNIKILKFIKMAINDDRIVPYFQPIVDLHTSKIIKYEALARLKLEDGTLLLPSEFLDIAKKTPYYHEITRIIIEKTLKVASEFSAYRFSINISMKDILNDKLVDTLLVKLQEHSHSASRLDIELLESESLQDITKVQNFIKEIKKYGCRILVDDFGSGYANFSHFSNLDIDLVKIDGSIVKDVNKNEKKLHMLKSIHNFTKGLGLENIAEYVEDEEVVEILKDIGVRYAQGYFFSQPLEHPLQDDSVSL